MNTIKIEIINPKVEELLKILVDLGLIAIKEDRDNYQINRKQMPQISEPETAYHSGEILSDIDKTVENREQTISEEDMVNSISGQELITAVCQRIDKFADK